MRSAAGHNFSRSRSRSYNSNTSTSSFAPIWLRQLVADSCKSMCIQFHQTVEPEFECSRRQQQQQQQQEVEKLAKTTAKHREKRIFDSRREFWNLFNGYSNQMMMRSQVNEETDHIIDSSRPSSLANQQFRQQQQQQQYQEDARQYDLVIFGASGTVGRFLVEEMALVIDKHYSTSQSQTITSPSVATSVLNLKELRDPLQFAQQASLGSNNNNDNSNSSARRVSVPRYVDGISWAVAGRSAVRLSDTLCKAEISTGVKGLSSGVPVILADLDHHRSLLEMCTKTGLVINCAGPYTSDGEALIRACVETRTNYIDLSHESNFVERIRQNYHAMARKNKLYIINGCGFQSMSAELGLNFIKQVVDGQIDEVKIMLNLNDTKALVRLAKDDGGCRGQNANDRSACGIITSGMWNSLIIERSQMGTNRAKMLEANTNKYSEETPNELEIRQKHMLRKDTQTLVRNLVEFRNKKTSGWLQLIKGFNEGGRRYCLPINSFTSDESQLTRGEMNHYELREPDLAEGWRPVICTSYLSLRNIYEVLILFIWMLLFEVFVRFPITRRLMQLAPSISTLGSVASCSSSRHMDRDALNHIKFCQTFIAYGTPGDNSGDPLEKREKHLKRKQEQLLVARVVGPEPNHVATATFAVQAALAMILEKDHLPAGGGVLTPGAAFADTNIIYQLKRRNIKFEVLKKA